MIFQAATVFVREPFGTDVFQEKIWVPGRNMSIIFLVASSFVETTADPARDAGGGFFFPFNPAFPVLFVSCFGGKETSLFSDQVRGPFDRQVLVREEGLLFLPIPGICP